ncbi:MAG TPA: spherulation-specific family 4 protein [Dermatophilaceae bacterium]|nr:spherulation-specific family 4 protein [Dermatophilaceae bacterium]
MKILAPAYGYPGTNRALWEGLLQAEDVLGHVIINPGSGPGELRDPEWTREVTALSGRGVPLLGYLNLAYSKKPMGALLAEADLWRRWYGIVDFFLDCAPSADVRRTAEVAEILRISARAGELVANAGTRTSYDVAQHFDAVVEHEGYPPFAHAGPEVLEFWLREHRDADDGGRDVSTGRSWIVYGADVAVARTTLESARAAGVHEIWLTDSNGANPYRDLPSYWPWLLEQLSHIEDRDDVDRL